MNSMLMCVCVLAAAAPGQSKSGIMLEGLKINGKLFFFILIRIFFRGYTYIKQTTMLNIIECL